MNCIKWQVKVIRAAGNVVSEHPETVSNYIFVFESPDSVRASVTIWAGRTVTVIVLFDSFRDCWSCNGSPRKSTSLTALTFRGRLRDNSAVHGSTSAL